MRAVVSPHPRLPEPLQPLFALAKDLRWTWRPSMRALFSVLDPAVWERVRGNPIELLAEVPGDRLERAASDLTFIAQMNAVRAELGVEDDRPPSHPAARTLKQRGDRIAYFSAEFGLTEVLPIYAGGLGVLAGDHLKASSDLGLPVVGIGLFYREGYFRQSLDPVDGQKESHPLLDPERLPMSFPATPDGGPPIVEVPIADRTMKVLIRHVRVGRVALLLLDTNLPENSEEDRAITARLYDGDLDMRIRQEIVLGIGGLRALDRLNWRPTIRHINEGHAAFVAIEKMRQLVQEEGLAYAEARERAASGNVFTTHTPVPAGIDRFAPGLVERYMAPYFPAAGMSFGEFLKLGQEGAGNPSEPFSMAVLALRLSAHANAVSQLHAKVSRRLWLGLLPELADEDVRIRAITNGVHRATWINPEIGTLTLLENPENVDPGRFWRTHEHLRGRLVDVCRRRIAEQRRERGAPAEQIEAAGRLLDPNALTIGFARRFATYKRAALIFHDRERLIRLLRSAPVQILFAGKAHPQDGPGKDLIRAIAAYAEQPDFAGRVVMLPDYDMALARALVAGCDVWLNNPIRPHEASGTSGMKAGMNGALNLSVLDGWWDEAPYEEAGFVIGAATDDAPEDQVAGFLYETLEQKVLPLFYNRNEQGLPLGWIEKMIQSASRIGRLFSADRMVTEYLEMCYVPAVQRKIAPALVQEARLALARFPRS